MTPDANPEYSSIVYRMADAEQQDQQEVLDFFYVSATLIITLKSPVDTLDI